MILQALTAYYDRLAEQGDVATEGFQKKEIAFIIVLDNDGHLIGLDDTREGPKKTARLFLVPHEVKRSGSKAWASANLLWDNVGYVFGYSAEKPEKASKRHESFKKLILDTFTSTPADPGVAAVLGFLVRGDFAPVFSHPLWPEITKTTSKNFSFRLQGDECLVCQRPFVMDAIGRRQHDDSGEKQTCLVTGALDIPARLHTAIKGVRGAQSTGANIVSFNLGAFKSYGKEQGLNAPVGRRAEFAYTTALNTLLAKGSRHTMPIADSTAVFWAEKRTPTADQLENILAEFFVGPGNVESARDVDELRALLTAPTTGTPPLEDDWTKFYVLGLAPNASRLAIRFWHAGTVAEIAGRVRQYFADCRIDHAPHHPDYLSLSRLLRATAVQNKLENVQPNMAGSVVKAILSGMPYPRTLLEAAVRRIRATHEVSYERAGIIKAVLKRTNTMTQEDIDVSLNKSIHNPGYLLGRLFAVLERIQESASPGINATIRDRFYGAASSTPVAVFPHLLKLKNHHIAKIENQGAVVNLERLVGEIMNDLDDLPVHMSLADQGRFAIGYYHQRQSFFTKRDAGEATGTTN